MTTFERGDIVLVPFPFSDQTAIKKRPAVIVSSNVYNRISADLVIMAITSKVEKALHIGEYKIKKWKEAGLLKVSQVKPAISTIEQNLVIKKLGKLTTGDLRSLNKSLKSLLDLE